MNTVPDDKDLTSQEVVAARVRTVRALSGWSQIDVQMKAGIDQSQFSQIEQGKEALSLANARAFAAVFKVTVGFLYEGILTNIHKDVEAYFRIVAPQLLAIPTNGRSADMDKLQDSYRADIPPRPTKERPAAP